MKSSAHAACPFHTGGAIDGEETVTGGAGDATLADLPGPRSLPILGNLLDLDLQKLHTILEGWAGEYGSMYKFHIAHKPVVAISDTALINEVLRKRPGAYRRFASIEPVLKEMGIDGVFSAEGHEWYRQRRTAMQALNTAHLRSFFPTLAKVTDRLHRRWVRLIEGRGTLDVQEDLMRYTIDVTSNLAFGYDVNTLEDKGADIQRHLEKVFPMVNRRINAPFPYWHFVRLPADRALEKALVAIREALTDFVGHSRARLARNPELATHPTNFLEAMLAAQDTGEAPITDDEIFGNVLTMLIGGEDSTAATMAWMLHFFAQHPTVQAQVQQEVDRVLGDKPLLHDIGDADRLPFLEAVAFETMRLKSVFPILFLGTNKDVELGGVRIPEGTALFLLTRKCGMQEHEFSSPNEFRPERWLEGACPEGAHNAKAFVPFGAGPRFCPGRNLAMLEMKSAMAMLCRSFTVVPVQGSGAVEEQYGFLMAPKRLEVKFIPREGSHHALSRLGAAQSAECPVHAGVAG
jgi:cytochrome P450